MRYLYLLPLFFVIIIAIFVWQNTTKSFSKDSIIESSSSIFISSDSFKTYSFSADDVHRLLLARTKQKKGVYLDKMEPSLDSLALDIVCVFHEVMGDSYVPTITSANDYPYHTRFSKHYYNKAIDFRTKDLNSRQKKELLEKAQIRIYKKGRVLLEVNGKSNEHLHLELLN